MTDAKTFTLPICGPQPVFASPSKTIFATTTMKQYARAIENTPWATAFFKTWADVLQMWAPNRERPWAAGPGPATHGTSITTVFRTSTSPMEWFLAVFGTTSTVFSGGKW